MKKLLLIFLFFPLTTFAFNAGVYPIITTNLLTNSTTSIAFSTTTVNSWSSLQTFAVSNSIFGSIQNLFLATTSGPTSGGGFLYLDPQTGVVSATTTTSITSFSSVDNPTQDYFNGVILFFIAFLFIQWRFHRKSKSL